MNAIKVCKADGFQKEKVEGTILYIDEELPKFDGLQEWENFAKNEAARVATALKSLPQGVRHYLLIEMLQDAKSLYRGA